MELFIGFIGFVTGLFLWSTVIGTIFASIPAQKRKVKEGVKEKVEWLPLLASVIVSLSIILAISYFSTPYFIGSSIAGVVMLFNIGNLKTEEKQTRG